jgi:cyclophilin family peptidyl-prolyl cis-trans isomerase
MKKVLFFILIFRLAVFCGCDACGKLKYYVESAVFETDSGSVIFTFFENDAPEHVKNFKELVKSGYYNGKKFHRVISGFVIQAGRDSSSAYSSIEPEINRIHFKGALAAARMGDEINPGRLSDGHEFYISIKPVPELDGSYTVFGRTAEGFETVEKIASSKTDKYDMPVSEIIIKRAYLDTYFDSEMYEYHRRIAGKE